LRIKRTASAMTTTSRTTARSRRSNPVPEVRLTLDPAGAEPTDRLTLENALCPTESVTTRDTL